MVEHGVQLAQIGAHLGHIVAAGQIDRDADGVAEFGKALRKDGKGKTSLYVRDLGKGEKVLTFVFWTE